MSSAGRCDPVAGCGRHGNIDAAVASLPLRGPAFPLRSDPSFAGSLGLRSGTPLPDPRFARPLVQRFGAPYE